MKSLINWIKKITLKRSNQSNEEIRPYYFIICCTLFYDFPEPCFNFPFINLQACMKQYKIIKLVKNVSVLKLFDFYIKDEPKNGVGGWCGGWIWLKQFRFRIYKQELGREMAIYGHFGSVFRK